MKVVARGYYDAVGNSADEGVSCPEPTLTVQSAKEETDINNIINKYLKTGEPPEMRRGIYADISEIGDLREAMEQVQFAHEAFMEFPAEVRAFFDNDPRKLVDFASDPRNLDKAIELGLAPPRKPSNVLAPGQGATGGTEPPAPSKGALKPSDA
jgi:hypothetical protein